MSLRHCLTLIFVLFVASSCTQASHKANRLFYGDCKVSVNAEPADAEIIIDGIPVGHHKVAVEIPCGEKQILVEKVGFKPYFQYQLVSRENSLHVKVELERAQKAEEYALSNELVEQVRNGKKLKNPFIGVENKSGAPEVEEAEEAAPIALDMGTGSGAQASAAGSLPPGDINSVDYWR